ncbi:MAG TPA: hypothetical protein VF297_08510 [Pyrinomonadaceae bacterium]
MGRKKRGSNVLELARVRLNGLKAIDPQLDLGNSLNVAKLEQAIDSLQTKLDRYNQKLLEADEELLGVETDESTLKDLNARFLAGVGARYGRNSVQYEKVGGVRTDDYKRVSRKSNGTPDKQN